MAAGIPPFTMAQLRAVLDRPIVRDTELRDLQLLHDGDPRIIHNERYFPKPNSMGKDEWEAVKRLLLYVNLVKPALRRFVSGVYGGSVTRAVTKDSAYSAELLEAVDAGTTYAQDARCHFENAGLFGTGVKAWVTNDDGELDSWLPNPVYTHLTVNPRNIRETWGVFEYIAAGKELLFMTREGMGVLRAGQPAQWQSYDWGFLPATVGYGQDRRHRGEPYGISLVREAPGFSQRVSDATMNLALLQKLYTRCLLVIMGNPDEESVKEALALHGILQIPAGVTGERGDAKYVNPEAKFHETIAVITHDVGLACTSMGLPRDAFDSQIAPNGDSAESAKLRAVPLTSQIAFLIEEWRQVEIDSLQRRAGMLQYAETGQPVTLGQLRKRVQVDVQIAPSSLPDKSYVESVAGDLNLLQWGIVSPADMAIKYNKGKTQQQLDALATAIQKHVDSGLAPKLPHMAPGTVTEPITKGPLANSAITHQVGGAQPTPPAPQSARK